MSLKKTFSIAAFSALTLLAPKIATAQQKDTAAQDYATKYIEEQVKKNPTLQRMKENNPEAFRQYEEQTRKVLQNVDVKFLQKTGMDEKMEAQKEKALREAKAKKDPSPTPAEKKVKKKTGKTKAPKK